MQPLHGVHIYVAGDRLANLIADGHRARVVHATPDACVVTICASLRNAGVRPARLSRRRQCEARDLLARQQTSKPALFGSATAYAALGDKDEAFRLLFRLADERDSLNYVKTILVSKTCTRILDGRCCFVA